MQDRTEAVAGGFARESSVVARVRTHGERDTEQAWAAHDRIGPLLVVLGAGWVTGAHEAATDRRATQRRRAGERVGRAHRVVRGGDQAVDLSGASLAPEGTEFTSD